MKYQENSGIPTLFLYTLSPMILWSGSIGKKIIAGNSLQNVGAEALAA